MSTIEDFENAPVGATATRADGIRAMKMGGVEQRWVLPIGLDADDEEMEDWGYTLDLPAPTTAREALDLAWELAHPVKNGQVIPAGTRYLQDQGSGLKENRARYDFNISLGIAPGIRTLDPLPEPLPDWLDAIAVLARHVKAPDSPPALWANLGNGLWGLAETTKRAEVWDLRDVTPLYPKERAGSVAPLYPKGQDA